MRKNNACSEDILIIGIGNPMYGDDAFGPLFTEALRDCGYPCPMVTDEGGTFYLSALLEGKRLCIFVDILEREYGEAGDVVVLGLKPEELSKYDYAVLFSRETAPHTVTPAHIVGMAYSAGMFSGEAVILGVVAANIDFGHGVSPLISSKVKYVCEKLSTLTGIRADCECVEKRFTSRAASYSFDNTRSLSSL